MITDDPEDELYHPFFDSHVCQPTDDDPGEVILARLDNLRQAGCAPIVIYNPQTRTFEVYYGNAGIDSYHTRLQEELDFDASSLLTMIR